MSKKQKIQKNADNRKEKSVLWFKEISIKDIPLVGGKTASLGEMYNNLTSKGINIPNGFAVTTNAYKIFFKENDLYKKIKKILKDLDVTDVKDLKSRGAQVRKLILEHNLPKTLQTEITEAYMQLAKVSKTKKLSVAVRSSATAEDLLDASFAGQQETYLNVVGKKMLLEAVKKCMASLFTDRAISYRENKGFDHLAVSLSVAIQQMVRSDKSASGVMFTLDTESGFQGVTLVTSAYGLGEYVVQGMVTPDQFYVFKEGIRNKKKAIISKILGSKEVKLVYGDKAATKQLKVPQKERNAYAISDDDVVQLASWGDIIGKHYGRPQDIEWAKDGVTQKLFIVQARPETVKANTVHADLETYTLKKKGKEILRGISVGQRIGSGKAHIIESPKNMKDFKKGEVLVTKITDPDWEPIMRLASAIVTEQGGKTSHAAIVSRELGVPCVVGAKDARKRIKQGQKITVSCASGDEGIIFDGLLPFELKRTAITNIPKTKTKIMMNVGDPDHAFSLSFLPNDGVGLARLEFIFTNFIRIHPLALVNYPKLKDKNAKKQIEKLTKGYKNKTDYCVEKLAEGVGRIATAFYPNPVIVRMSDFKTNEYATLIGGAEFEPHEENPMIGWRGASRYYSKEYKKGFELECRAIKKAREDWGLKNIVVMIPFCRTPEEGEQVLQTMKEFGLERGKDGLEVFVMCEIPSNVILAEEFAKIFDGFSIGSNDLTQLTLGIDRDTSSLSDLGNANNPAVKNLIAEVIRVAKKHKKKIGICGQAPSDYPDFAQFLVSLGIDSISLNPDTIISTRERIAVQEKKRNTKGLKKVDTRRLGLVALCALVGGFFVTLGAGCSNMASEFGFGTQEQKNVAQVQVTPAQLREKTENNLKQNLKEEIKKEILEEMRSEYSGFLSDDMKIDIGYPSSWKVSQGKEQLLFSQNEGSHYFSIELVSKDESKNIIDDLPVSGKVSFGNLQGNRYESIPLDSLGKNIISVFSYARNQDLVIRGTADEYDSIIQSLKITEK